MKRLTPRIIHGAKHSAKHDDWQAFSASQAHRHKPARTRQAHLLLKLRPRAAQRSHSLQVAPAAAQLARKAGFIFLRAARRPAPDWLRSKLNSSCSDAGLAVPAAPSPAACAPHAEARQARALRLNSCQQAPRLQTRAAAPALQGQDCTGAYQVPCGAGQGAGAGAPQPPDHPGPGLAPHSLFLVFSHTVFSSTVRHPSAHLVPTTN